jgi:hypothetical protein
MTTEELFRLKYEHEQKLKEISAGYSSKLRKRAPQPKDHVDNTEFLSPVIKQRDRNREFFRNRAERERQNKQELQARVDSFINQLGSKSQADVEVNALVLAEIMRSFSLTFGVGSEKIASLISKEEGGVNIEEIRKKIMAQGE